MRRPEWFAVRAIGPVLCLLALPPALAVAGRTPDRRAVTIDARVTAEPSAVVSPLSSTNTMTVCVSGFAEGNFVSVSIPWIGTAETHSVLSFSGFIDATGGFCVRYPPDWTTARLEPGLYTIATVWYRDGGSDQRLAGPATTFEVLGD